MNRKAVAEGHYSSCGELAVGTNTAGHRHPRTQAGEAAHRQEREKLCHVHVNLPVQHGVGDTPHEIEAARAAQSRLLDLRGERKVESDNFSIFLQLALTATLISRT
jgi:hypothetical protein